MSYEYLNLGVRQILTGYDPLLFILCLIFNAGTTRRILIAVTGFTLAHSVTFALSALEAVRIPAQPVKAAIALSIIFLAVELARGKTDTSAYWHPIAASTSFGLLHGLGFAAVLSEIGLPQTDIPRALFFFSVSIDIGQSAFVVLSIFILATIRKWLAGRDTSATTGSCYLAGFARLVSCSIGSLASVWMIERTVFFWS